MITLFTYAPAFGQPASSPFCVKAIYLLNLSGALWKREDQSDPRKFPLGKLPAIRSGETTVGDSDAIRDHLAEMGHDVDAHLSTREKADARAFTRMAEEHLYFHLVMDRWGDDRAWPIVRDTYFAAIPKLVRGFITHGLRKQALQGLHFTGIARQSEAMRLQRVDQDLRAITARLSGASFLFGERPSSADASVAAMLSAIAVTPVETKLTRRVVQDAELMDYCARVATACGVTPSA